MILTSDAAALLTLRISLIGIVIICAEILYARADYGSRGVLNWDVIRTMYSWTAHGHIARRLDGILRYPRFLWLTGIILVAALALFLNLVQPWRLYVLTLIVACWLLVQLRLRYGLDGADQMLSIVFISMWFYYATTEPALRAAAITFLGLQLLLSYVTAGIAKLLSPEWRRGSAMPGILRTRSYGTPGIARILQTRPTAARAICHGVIAFECLGWLAVFVNTDWCVAFIVGGLAFHLATAFAMGLNTFFWSFASSFPAVYVLSQTVERWRTSGDILSVFAGTSTGIP